MAEVARQEGGGEEEGAVDYEGGGGVAPADQVGVCVVFQHFVQFSDEGGCACVATCFWPLHCGWD